jgi:alpha-ketoglutaric semialdehyde dehydrogenase
MNDDFFSITQRRKGAKFRCLFLEKILIHTPIQQCHFFQPTILDNVTPTMRVAQEEIFGPVVAIIEINSFEKEKVP